MRSQDYEPHHFKPIWLDKDEEEDPVKNLTSFFDSFQLPESRFYLWEMLSGYMDGRREGFHYQCDGSQMLFFYEQLMRLIESAHLLREQKKKKKHAK